MLAGIGVYLFVIEGQGRTLEEIDTMYLLGVKPWESAKWIVPPLEEMDGKTRQRLEEMNPEIAVLNERTGQDMGTHGENEIREPHGADGEGSEVGLNEKKEIGV